MDSHITHWEGFVESGNPLYTCLKDSAGYSSAVSTVNHTIGGEMHAWPDVMKTLEELDAWDPENADICKPTIESSLARMVEWKSQCRDGSLGVKLQPRLSSILMDWADKLEARGKDGENIDKIAVEVLDLVNKASLLWKDPNFGPFIDRLSVNAKNFAALEKVNGVVKQCDDIIAASTFEEIDKCVHALDEALPAAESRQVIVVEEQSQTHIAWQALDVVSKNVWQAETLSASMGLARACGKFACKVEIKHSATDTGFKQNHMKTAKSVSVSTQVLNLVDAVQAWETSGNTDAARSQTQDALARVQQIVGTQDRLNTELLTTALEDAPGGLQRDIKDMQGRAHEIIASFSGQYITAAWPHLEQEYNVLMPMAKGGVAHKAWDTDAPQTGAGERDDAKWIEAIKPTLGKVDVQELIKKTKNCATVRFSFNYD